MRTSGEKSAFIRRIVLKHIQIANDIEMRNKTSFNARFWKLTDIPEEYSAVVKQREQQFLIRADLNGLYRSVSAFLIGFDLFVIVFAQRGGFWKRNNMG